MIKKLADENLKVNLALSLHSAIEETRNKIMPFSKYSSKQKKLAAVGGNRKKIDAADFKKLRNSTTAKKVMKKKKR